MCTMICLLLLVCVYSHVCTRGWGNELNHLSAHNGWIFIASAVWGIFAKQRNYRTYHIDFLAFRPESRALLYKKNFCFVVFLIFFNSGPFWAHFSPIFVCTPVSCRKVIKLREQLKFIETLFIMQQGKSYIISVFRENTTNGWGHKKSTVRSWGAWANFGSKALTYVDIRNNLYT